MLQDASVLFPKKKKFLKEVKDYLSNPKRKEGEPNRNIELELKTLFKEESEKLRIERKRKTGRNCKFKFGASNIDMSDGVVNLYYKVINGNETFKGTSHNSSLAAKYAALKEMK